MRNRVAILHGVNFDVLHRRPAMVYGDFDLSSLERTIEGFAGGTWRRLRPRRVEPDERA